MMTIDCAHADDHYYEAPSSKARTKRMGIDASASMRMSMCMFMRMPMDMRKSPGVGKL